MSAKHQDAEYQRNAKIIKAQVRALHKSGQPAMCWSCRGPIAPGAAFDVGHIDVLAGHALSNLAPQHRGENRADGARRTNILRGRTRATVQTARKVTTWRL